MTRPLKILVVFSDPSDLPRLHLTKEHRDIEKLAEDAGDAVAVKFQQASQIQDIRKLICEGDFNVIQFSGHGDPNGIYVSEPHLEKGELVSAEDIVKLMGFAATPPRLVIFLACYSSEYVKLLTKAAPYVITADTSIPDEACVTFITSFYDRFFRTNAIEKSLEFARYALEPPRLSSHRFRLDRRPLVQNPDGIFVECPPVLSGDTILVNLDAVRDSLDSFGMPRRDLIDLIGRRLRYHDLILACPRQRAVLPVGLVLVGEFRWEDANDVVYCTKLMKMRQDLSEQHREVWASLLTAYNDMASNEYRLPKWGRNPPDRIVLKRAVKLLDIVIRKFKVARKAIQQIGLDEVLLSIDFASAQCESASDALTIGQHPQVVSALEKALTLLHGVVDGLQPPQETGG